MPLDGTLVGNPSFVPSIEGFGLGLLCDGPSQYMSIPNGAGTVGAHWTIEFRFQLLDKAAAYTIFDNGQGLIIGTDLNGHLTAAIPGVNAFNVNHDYVDGFIHHICMVLNAAGNNSIGDNGANVGSTFGTYNGPALTNLKIGKGNCLIDELRISSVARYNVPAGYLVPGAPFIVDGSTIVLYHFENNALNGDGPLASGTITAEVTETSVTLSTIPPSSGGTGPYNIQFQRAPDVAGAPGIYANVGPNSVATTYTDSSVTPRTRYWYRYVTTDSTLATVTSNAIRVIPAIASAFFVDSILGNDSNAGTGPGAAAWKTIAKVTATAFVPGDSITLAPTETFPGSLIIQDSGEYGNPIAIDATGATINTTIAADHGIVLQDCGFVTVRNPTLVGPGVSATGVHTSQGYGVRIRSDKTATGETYYMGIRIENCTISGYLWPFAVEAANGTPTVGAANVSGVSIGYADLRINGITILDGGRRGIDFGNANTHGDAGPLAQCYYCKGIYIGNCLIKNVYGQLSVTNDESGTGMRLCGIKGFGDTPSLTAENIVVEDCGSRNNAQGGVGGPVGIYLVSCDFLLLDTIQVTRQLTGGNNNDGGGLDFDGAVTNCVFQNYVTRDCFAYSTQNYTFSGLSNSGNVFRNGISVNDARVVGPILTGEATCAARYENCTIYSNATTLGRVVNIINGGGNNCTYTNCNFVLLNGSTFEIDVGSTLQNNNYWFGVDTFHFKWGGVTRNSIAEIQQVAESVYGSATGYSFDPNLPVPVAGQSCAQLVAQWLPAITGPLLTAGITPPVVGSGVNT